MVTYTCPRCKMSFPKKSQYDKHMNRKTPCEIRDAEPKILKDFECKCGKKYNRKDHLKEHIDRDHNGDITYNLGLKQNINIDQNIIDEHNNNHNNGNKNTNIQTRDGNIEKINIDNSVHIVNYHMVPFGKDGVDCLSTREKIAIFSSKENPIEMIIVKVNFDPKKIDHHNCEYTNMHSGTGYVFDGDDVGWIKQRIGFILKTLLETKRDDLRIIHDQIKQFLSEDTNKQIKTKIDGLYNIDAESKKILLDKLKQKIYDGRKLPIEARKRTKHLYSQKKHTDEKLMLPKTFLREGTTVE